MNWTRALVVLALGMATFVAACEEDSTIPPAPAKPEQITSVTKAYSRSSTGLPSGDVSSFLTTTEGEFWVGTRAGVAIYATPDATTNQEIINEINGLPHPQVTAMVEHAGKVYVGTWGGGLGVYDTVGNAWTQIRPATGGLENGFVAGVAASESEGKLYFATNDGVFIYDTIGWEHFSTADTVTALPEGDTDTAKLQQVVSSVELIDTLSAVQRWYGPRVEVRIDDAHKKYHGITVSKTSSCYCVEDTLTVTRYKYTPDTSGLVEPNVNDMFYDQVTETVWVAYVSKGISQVNAGTGAWTNYTLVQGLPSNTVLAIARAQDNENATSVIWAATQGGLAKLINGHWESYNVSGGLPSSRTRSLYSDNGVRLWVGFVDAGAIRIK